MRKYFVTLLLATAAVGAVGLRFFLSTRQQHRGGSVVSSKKAAVIQPLQTRSSSLPAATSARVTRGVANATTRTIVNSLALATPSVSGTAVIARGGAAASAQDGTSRSQNTVA